MSLVERAEKWLRSKRSAARKAAGAGTGPEPGAGSGAGAEAKAGAPSGTEAGHTSGARPGAEGPTPLKLARGRYVELAPVLRGALALPSGDADRPYLRFVLRPLITEEVLAIVDSDRGREVCLTPPLTSDHLIRTKPIPLWIDDPGYGSAEKAAERIPAAIADYARGYDDYFRRNAERMEPGLRRFDSMPRVILMPGLGAVCAGANALEADVVRDITAHTLRIKGAIFETGVYEGLDEGHLFDMEYFDPQHRKLDPGAVPPLGRTVALITGAAGAIGAGISEELLGAGCHVALTDLPGDALESYAEELRGKYGGRVMETPMDVTDRKSVSAAFDSVVGEWGGIDLVVVTAGVAHVSSIAEMKPDDFRRAERVNVEGALHVLSEAGVHFKLQGTGGDIVIISTKNVFAPGAGFGAYSATKAAAHQLGRIASQEMAPLGVRVNMVSPDAVFSHGERKSGLWAEVGPGRMRARGLDEKGLEEYYVSRNLLKAKVTASHVAKAVLFFATRQTPTTGATIPVDGGLPDSTPR
jgi:NAD(P)-dependent dehydrogenase (short-subunit alcohol dehydrogenase family)